MPQLDRIKIKGFKSIKDSEVKLSSLNLLIGPNGAGKSNFISFFKMLNEMVNQRLQNYVTKSGGSNALLYFGQKHTDSIDAYLEFGKNAYEFVLEPTINNQMFFAKEYISYHEDNYPKPWENYLGSGHKETSLISASKNKQGYSVAELVSSNRGQLFSCSLNRIINTKWASLSGVDLTWDPTSDASMGRGIGLIRCIPLG